MNPAKFAQMIKYLTRVKKQKPDLPDVFPASELSIPTKTKNVEEIEAINRFVRDNPRTEKAGGGMLVQPGFGGTRQGYNGDRRGKGTPKSDSSIAQARRETFAARGDPGESYRKVVKDFVATPGPGTGRIFDDPAAIDIVKANLNKIKKQRNNKALFEWSEDSDWYRKLRKE